MNGNDMFPWDEIPNSDTLEDCDCIVEGVNLVDGESQSTGKRMFKAEMAIVEPAIYAGMHQFENFVTGTDEAPKAIVAGTMGTKRMKRMVMAAQIPAANNVGVLCAAFPKTRFGISVSKYNEKDGEYKGQERNRISSFWKIGEKTPGVKAAKGAGVGAGGAARAPIAAPPIGLSAMPPTIPGAMSAPVMPAAPPPPPAPSVPVAPTAPAAPAYDPIAAAEKDGWAVHPTAPGYHFKGQEVLVDAALAGKYPALAPISAPPPPAAPPAAPTAPVAPPAGPPSAPGLTQLCTMCGQQVPLASLAAHVVACAASHGVTK